MAESLLPGRAGRNTAHLTAGRIIVALSGMLLVAVVYEALGAEDFGVWVVLSSLVGVLGLLDLGLTSAVVREAADSFAGSDRRRAQGLMGLALIWAFLLAGAAVIVTLLAWTWLSGSVTWGRDSSDVLFAALWLILGFLFGAVEVPWRALLEGAQDYALVSWSGAATAVVAVALSIMVVRMGAGLPGLAAASAAAAALRMGITIGVARHRFPGFAPSPGRVDRSDIRFMRTYGLRVQVSNISSGVNVELDRLVLAAVAGPIVAGAFDIGTRLLNLLRMAPGFALMALFPAIVAGSASRGRDWLDRVHLAATRYMNLAVVPAAVALIVCADPLILLWLGEPVPWAATNLAILAGAYALNLVSGPGTIVARAEGRPSMEMRYVTLSVILNLALTLPCIWLLGPIGVPVSTALAVCTSTAYFFVAFHRGTSRDLSRLMPVLWPPVVAAAAGGAAAATAALWLLPEVDGRFSALVAVVLRAVIVFAVAGGLLLLVGYIDGDDRARFRRFGHALVGRSPAPGVDLRPAEQSWGRVP